MKLLAILSIAQIFLLQSIICQQSGDVREVGPDKVIESYYEKTKEWLPVCQTSIDRKEMDAICKSLGRKSFKNIGWNKSCAHTTVYISKKLQAIDGYFGIDMSKNSQNSFSRSCNENENFKQCLDRYKDYQWKKSDCRNENCFSLECEIEKNIEEEQKLYGTSKGENKKGDAKLTSKDQLYVYTGDFWDPVCPSGFKKSEGEAACKTLGYDSYKDHSEVSCNFPKKDGFRDHNFQTIDCIIYDESLSECSIWASSSCQNQNKCIKLECGKTNYVAIIVGTIAGVIVLGLLIGGFIYYRKRKQQQQQQQQIQKQQQQFQDVQQNQPTIVPMNQLQQQQGIQQGQYYMPNNQQTCVPAQQIPLQNYYEQQEQVKYPGVQ